MGIINNSQNGAQNGAQNAQNGAQNAQIPFLTPTQICVGAQIDEKSGFGAQNTGFGAQKSIQVSQDKPDIKKIVCQYCNKIFTHSGSMNRHINFYCKISCLRTFFKVVEKDIVYNLNCGIKYCLQRFKKFINLLGV